MELILDIENSLVLEVRFSGQLDAYASPGTRSAEPQSAGREETPSPARGKRARPAQLKETAPAPKAPAAPARPVLPPLKTAAPAAKLPRAKPARLTAPPKRSRPAAAAASTPLQAEPPVKKPEDPAALPAELSHLPKKHQDFYARKFAEYLEVYQPEKARDLAIQAVRSIAGHGPRR